jgi:RimJ/RimL family protein N-acetyltransferase
MQLEIRSKLERKLPKNIRLLDFSLAHALLLEHDPFQQAQIDYMPDWLDRLEIQAGLGPAFTLLEDGRIISIFGACEIMPAVAEMWLLLHRTNYAKGRHGGAYARFSRDFVETIGATMALQRIQCSVECENLRAIRFAKWLYFQTEGRMRKHGHADHFLMARIF